jgi:uncharacterized protein (DUF1697 family)
MTVYIALLRAVNVSGKNILNMKELKAALEQNGFKNPETYIQSGNIIFKHPSKSSTELENQLTNCLKEQFNLTIDSRIYSIQEFNSILNQNPFSSEINLKDLYLTFLFEKPITEKLNSLPSSGNDRWKIHNQVIYLHCPDGYGKTKLSNNLFESKLKTAATTRNGRTCLKLREMAEVMNYEL